MRFDGRGAGDSEGNWETAEENYEDIRNAIDVFVSSTPGLDQIVLWGLCDSATTALLYAPTDPRIVGIVAVNPGMDVEHATGGAYMRYYSSRLANINFWTRIATRKFDYFGAARTFLNRFATALKFPKRDTDNECVSIRERTSNFLSTANHALLVILSGEDINAYLFEAATRGWLEKLDGKRVTVYRIPGANHVFSRREWRDQLASKTVEWITHNF
jgi:dienelactone hydrolase